MKKIGSGKRIVGYRTRLRFVWGVSVGIFFYFEVIGNNPDSFDRKERRHLERGGER
jgi:hypothetical protein